LIFHRAQARDTPFVDPRPRTCPAAADSSPSKPPPPPPPPPPPAANDGGSVSE
jgi:hypothetical protein